jgi:caffeoyl-CoA O-methyltransferase
MAMSETKNTSLVSVHFDKFWPGIIGGIFGGALFMGLKMVIKKTWKHCCGKNCKNCNKHDKHGCRQAQQQQQQQQQQDNKTDYKSPYYKTGGLTPQLHQYMVQHSTRNTHLLEELQSETFRVTGQKAGMCSPLSSVPILQMLCHLTQAKKAMDVGVFTGFTTLAIALVLPEDGKVVGLDVSEEWANIGKPYWQRGNVIQKIDLRIAPAIKTMDELLEQKNEVGTYDFIFIDADKDNYGHYYERALALLRRGGVVAIDNVFWGGRVIDPAVHDVETVAIRSLNTKIHQDTRVQMCMIATSDGMTVARKL